MAKFGIALGSGPRGLGFESRHSDQTRKSTHRVGFLGWMGREIRKDGTSAHTCVKKCPVDTFLVRGRILWFLDASLVDVDRNQICLILETPYRHSDQKTGDRICGHRFFNWSNRILTVSGRSPLDCERKSKCH